MKKKYLYGMTGFLALLGFAGIFTDIRSFLAFFAFAVDFQYFFRPSDEMLEQQMTQSAAFGFYAGMLLTAGGTLCCLLCGFPAEEALLNGFAVGWVAAVLVHAAATACYGFREHWGSLHD